MGGKRRRCYLKVRLAAVGSSRDGVSGTLKYRRYAGRSEPGGNFRRVFSRDCLSQLEYSGESWPRSRRRGSNVQIGAYYGGGAIVDFPKIERAWARQGRNDDLLYPGNAHLPNESSPRLEEISLTRGYRTATDFIVKGSGYWRNPADRCERANNFRTNYFVLE